MLAINSDVEWTRWSVQIGLLRELAARNLETAFSFWLFSSPEVTWRMFDDDGSRTQYADAAFALARAGLLDTNHGIGGRRHLGGCSYDRATIAKAYEVLAGETVCCPIFSNHGSREDRQNIAGAWADYQEGDLPGSDLYHLDLTLMAGARYFWCDPDYVTEQPALIAAVDSPEGLFTSGLGRDGNTYLRFRRYFGTGLVGGPSLNNLGVQLGQILDS